MLNLCFAGETCEEYEKAVSALALKVLHMISLSLGLPAERLDYYLQNQGSYLLVNYYPTCPNPKLPMHLPFSPKTRLGFRVEVKRKSSR